MQSTGRDRSPHALAKRAPAAVPPPPPNRRPVPASLDADPQWLEEAVLRIIQKHALVVPSMNAVARSVAPPRRRSSRLARVAQGLLIVAILAGTAAYVLHTRFPARAAAISSGAKGMFARIPPPRSWFASRSEATPVAPYSGVQAPIAPVQVAPAPIPPAPTSAAPIPTAKGASPSTQSVDVSALPVAAAPSVEPKSDKNEKSEARRASRASHARAHATSGASASLAAAATGAPAPAPATVPASSPAPVAAPIVETRPAPPPIPGPLGEAIRRASGAGTAPVTTPHAVAQGAAPSTESLPERPTAPLVKAALYAALPAARACMGANEEPAQAVVVFESSGGVSSVQVSGPSAACIQKAFRGARVPPFSQTTYRAGVPVRPN